MEIIGKTETFRDHENGLKEKAENLTQNMILELKGSELKEEQIRKEILKEAEEEARRRFKDRDQLVFMEYVGDQIEESFREMKI